MTIRVKPPVCDLVIFDCDGVLIDSETIANEVCANHMRSLGYAMTMQDFALRYSGSPIADIWRRVEADYGIMIDSPTRSAIDADIHALFAMTLKTVDGVADMLDRLSIRSCVASSTGLQRLRRNLDQVGLLARFEPGVFSASQVARGKPAPDVFLYAASQMGVDPDRCLVVEDSLAGVSAARRAGMRTIGFSGGGHVDGSHPERLKHVGASDIALSMSGLSTLLEAYA